MTGLLHSSMTRAWAVLVVATLLSVGLAESGAAGRTATVAVMLIAAFKVRLVFLHFMELDSGAMPWRAVLEVWVAAVTLLILGTYLLTPG